jgi:hypothetical protein
VIALFTWQPPHITPSSGLDGSWPTGLVMAAHRGLDFGTQVIFTYGPLGFLRLPRAMYGGLALVSLLYALAVRVGLAAAVLWAARHRLSLPVAVAVAVAASLITTPEAIVVIAFICCAAALAEDPPRRAASLVTYGGGLVSAVEVLVKLNTGLLVLAFCLVTVLVMEGNRLANLLRFGSTLVATLAVSWFAAGQGLGNVDDFFRASYDVIGGYSAAMALDQGRRGVIEAALVVLCLTFGAWVIAVRRLPRPRAAGLLALVALLGFLGWKEGFVREDPPHAAFFFSWMATPWIALTWIRGWGRTAGLAGFAVIVALFYGSRGYFPTFPGPAAAGLDPIVNAKAAINDVYDLVDPAARDAERDRARFTLALQYGLDRETRALIGQQPVDVYPSEISLAWAYGLNWDPLPVFQTYAGYTPLLDRRNASALSSSDGPRMILRQAVGTIDGRFPSYDTPAATLAMLCNFEPLRTTSRFQLLGRVADRCGRPHEIASVDADYGQAVQVPSPPDRGEAIFARVSGLNPTGIEKLRALLYKPAFRSLTIDGKWTYRLVSATAGDGLLLSTPPSGDFSAPRFESAAWSWKLAPRPNATTITVEKSAAVASPDNRLRIDFYAMPVRGRHGTRSG